MNINQFYDYKHRCPFCDKFLFKAAEFDIAIYRDQINEFAFIGSIVYEYDGSRFNKFRSEIYRDPDPETTHYHQQKHKVMNKLADTAIDSFSINKRIFPKLNISHYLNNKGLQELSADFAILDMRFQSSCINRRHIYYYQTSTILPGAKLEHDVIDIDSEMLGAFGYRIFNSIDSKFPSTSITKDGRTSKTSEHYNLPLVPMNNWKLNSKSSLASQIQSYNLLK